MSKNYENEFFKHFEDSPDDPLSELFAENGQPDEFEEMGELILRYQDGDISQSQFARLQNCILGDCRALTFYVDYTCLCMELAMLLNPKMDKLLQKSLFAAR